MADVWFNWENNRKQYSLEEQLLIEAAFTLFDAVDFVYRFTHYDTCANGRFYRMS